MTRKALVAPSESKLDVTASPGKSYSPWHSEDKTLSERIARSPVLPVGGMGGGQVFPSPEGSVVGTGEGSPRPAPAPGDLPWHLKTNWDKRMLTRNSRDIAAFREYLEFTGKLTLDLTLYDMEKRETVVLHLPLYASLEPSVSESNAC